MKIKFCALLAGASMIALASAANAAQPLALSDTQMDRVTAGAAAAATGQALAIGDFLTFTQTVTASDAVTSLTITNSDGTLTRINGSALGQATSLAAAASALFQAAAATSSQSAATLP